MIECDFLQPTHNKQDFDQSKAFRYESIVFYSMFIWVYLKAVVKQISVSSIPLIAVYPTVFRGVPDSVR